MECHRVQNKTIFQEKTGRRIRWPIWYCLAAGLFLIIHGIHIVLAVLFR
jgi:hypothetical protein